MIEAAACRVEGQHSFFESPFPLVIAGSSTDAGPADAAAWVRARRDELTGQLDRHGAILFRGFPLRSAQDFDGFVAAFDWPNFPYDQSLSNAVRINRTERVFTANEAPPEVRIHLHHEMAQTPVYPARILFFCEQPARTGGATPLCRSDALWERLRRQCPDFASACAEKGLRYTNVMPSDNDADSGMGRSWRSTLRAESESDAERRLSELGYTFEWLPDGCLRATTPVLPAVRELAGGRSSFFNQLIAAHQGWRDARNDPSRAITHGDGSALDVAGVAAAVGIAEELTFDVPWVQGDVALVDNFAVMHGRRTFTGTRRVLASLACPERLKSHG